MIIDSVVIDPNGDSLRHLLDDSAYPVPATDTIYMDFVTGKIIWNKPIETGRYLLFIRFYDSRPWLNALGLSELATPVVVDIKEDFITSTTKKLTSSPIPLQILPNPTSDYFQLYFPEEDYEISKITLFNALGQSVKTITHYQPNTSIEVKHLPKGIYFVLVQTDKGFTKGQLVLQ